jgi:predicted AAA+ superfamily ATPase
MEAWPFAPHLLKLLDDQVLIAADAQETRDLIKILVDLYKQAGEDQPIITAADFSLTNEKSGVASLLDSVANELHKDLRGKALKNLELLRETVPDASKTLPHLDEIMSALWLRSLTLDKVAGADPSRSPD